MFKDDAPSEAAAIIGVACRLPGGVTTVDQFWIRLSENAALASEIDPERWAHYSGSSPEREILAKTVRCGTFLDDVDKFDCHAFGLTPREAEAIDPQQRLLLEVVYEAIIDSNLALDELAAVRAGVFAGVCNDDYRRQSLEDIRSVDPWTGIGVARCGSANRVSYVFNLTGPSITIDTACSSSLVALHTALISLRRNECDIAVVASANLALAPGETRSLELAGALAQDGRCKPFDNAADGYGRGEGAIALVLRRPSEVNERIMAAPYAVVRGSAVNHDGRTDGIMAPSKAAQIAVMRDALRDARMSPAEISYVEAHGTGTPLGDSIEAEAIGAFYGNAARRALPIGSAKGHFGHLEGAAGLLGVLKCALGLQRGKMPGTVAFTTENSRIDWGALNLRLPGAGHERIESEPPCAAGVSSYGFGGTNSHVIVARWPSHITPIPTKSLQSNASLGSAGVRRWHVYPLKAASRNGLMEEAGALSSAVRAAAASDVASVGRSLAARGLPSDGHYGAVVADSAESLIGGLTSMQLGELVPNISRGVPQERTSPVWVFSGHGCQWPNMGQALIAESDAFRTAISSLDDIYASELGIAASTRLASGTPTGDVVEDQALIFAIQIGLQAMWREAGSTPEAVVGHSVGEIAAAVASGELSVEDATYLACRRAKLLGRIAGTGAMAMVNLSAEDASIRLHGSNVEVAVASSTQSCVVSGERGDVLALAESWSLAGMDVRLVATDVAFHSTAVDCLLSDLETVTNTIVMNKANTRRYCTATIDTIHPGQLAPSNYWLHNLRDPVLLRHAIERAMSDRQSLFVELAPHPVLSRSIDETISDSPRQSSPTSIIHTVTKRDGTSLDFARSVAKYYCAGGELDWNQHYTDVENATRVTSGRAWQRQSLWRRPTRPASGLSDLQQGSLLGEHIPATTFSELWRGTVTLETRPYEGRHTIGGAEIVPAAVLVGTFLAIAESRNQEYVLLDLVFSSPLFLHANRTSTVYVTADGERAGISAQAEHLDGVSVEPWHQIANCTYGLAEGLLSNSNWTMTARTALCDNRLAEVGRSDLLNEYLESVGVVNTSFPWHVEELSFRPGGGYVSAIVGLSDATPREQLDCMLDAAFSLAPLAFPQDGHLRMANRIGMLQATATDRHSRCRVVVVANGKDRQEGTLDAYIGSASEDDPDIICAMHGLEYATLHALAVDPRSSESDVRGPQLAVDSTADIDDLVLATISRVMGTASADLDRAHPLADQGVDSIMTGLLRHELSLALGTTLPLDLFWNRPSFNDLVAAARTIDASDTTSAT